MRPGRRSAGVGAGQLERQPRGRGGRLRLRVRVGAWCRAGRQQSHAEHNLGDGGLADGGNRGAGDRLHQAAAPAGAHQLLRR